MDFLKLIRFPNLIIIVIIQYILQYWILRPAFIDAGLSLLLTHNLFFLLVCSTVLIAATGYVINDIVDVEIDKINKPHKMIVERVITIKHAWQLYWGLFAIGLLISFYVAYWIDNLPLVLIYPFAVGLLALYSYKLKAQPFSGNLVVALFSAMVTGIILFAERASLAKLYDADLWSYVDVSVIFYGYIIFSVLMSLYREIVKDLEDVEGDKLQGCRTIPSVMGIDFGRSLSLFFAFATLVLLFSLMYMNFKSTGDLLLIAIVCLLVVLPLLYSIFKLRTSKESKDYHHVSTCIKGVMVGGILCLFLF